MRPRSEGFAAADDSIPLAMPGLSKANEILGTEGLLVVLRRIPLSAAFADDPLLPALSFHENSYGEEENDEWRPRAPFRTLDAGGVRDADVGAEDLI